MIKFTASIIILIVAPLIGFIIGRKMGLRDAAVTVEAEFADLIVMSGMIIEKGRIVPR